MMGNSVWRAGFALAGAISLLCGGCKQKELEPTPPEPTRPTAAMRPALQFKPVSGAGESVQEAHLVTQSLPQLHSRLEIATIIIQAGKPVILPMQYEGILELRAGSLATVVENNRQIHRRGDMWQIAKGDRVTLQASGELAVVRTIYLIPGEK
jgi:hypothetical protein